MFGINWKGTLKALLLVVRLGLLLLAIFYVAVENYDLAMLYSLLFGWLVLIELVFVVLSRGKRFWR